MGFQILLIQQIWHSHRSQIIVLINLLVPCSEKYISKVCLMITRYKTNTEGKYDINKKSGI
jgi:NADH:ubiquinone oxidoreductase subunit K